MSAAAFVAFGVLVWRVHGGIEAMHAYRRGTHSPDLSRTERQVFDFFSDLGGEVAVVLASFALVLVEGRRGRDWRRVVLCAAVPIVVSAVGELVLKPLIDRHSAGGGLAFPSGHATGITSVATVAWLVWVTTWSTRLARAAGTAALVVLIALVCVSRVGLHAHDAIDVEGGVLYGLAATLGCSVVLLRPQ